MGSSLSGKIGALDHSEDRRPYLALFGGISTRTFLDPSPSELRGTQDDLTRDDGKTSFI